MIRLHRMSCVFVALLIAAALSLGVSATSPLSKLEEISSCELANGVELMTFSAIQIL